MPRKILLTDTSHLLYAHICDVVYFFKGWDPPPLKKNPINMIYIKLFMQNLIVIAQVFNFCYKVKHYMKVVFSLMTLIRWCWLQDFDIWCLFLVSFVNISLISKRSILFIEDLPFIVHSWIGIDIRYIHTLWNILNDVCLWFS